MYLYSKGCQEEIEGLTVGGLEGIQLVREFGSIICEEPITTKPSVKGGRDVLKGFAARKMHREARGVLFNTISHPGYPKPQRDMTSYQLGGLL